MQTLLPYAFNVQEPLLITVSLPRPIKGPWAIVGTFPDAYRARFENKVVGKM